MALGRDAILTAKDRTTEVVPVPEWGGEVNIRTLSGEQRDLLDRLTIEWRNKKSKNIRAVYVIAAVVGDDGEPLFTEEHLEVLGAKSAVPLTRIWLAVRKQNAMDEAEVEDLAKNSGPGPSDSSGSS